MVVFMMFSSKSVWLLSLHHEDDFVSHNGSVGPKKMWILFGTRSPLLRQGGREDRRPHHLLPTGFTQHSPQLPLG
jgi:hypothetical protein